MMKKLIHGLGADKHDGLKMVQLLSHALNGLGFRWTVYFNQRLVLHPEPSVNESLVPKR
jgi:hypothetical protein